MEECEGNQISVIGDDEDKDDNVASQMSPSFTLVPDDDDSSLMWLDQ